MSEREVRNLIIPEGLNQERVDAALSRLLGLSRNVIVGLIESDEEITKYYTHSIGHFLGLDVHDIGIYNKELLEGMDEFDLDSLNIEFASASIE